MSVLHSTPLDRPQGPIASSHRSQPKAFTLVELMIVIVVIGILMALLIPAVNYARIMGQQTALRSEVDALNQAVEQYNLKHGDYPPDGSSWVVMQRHINRVFPRISALDITLLYNMCHEPDATVARVPAGASGVTFSPYAIDRAESLVLFLGGLSSDVTHPFTGEGGPFERVAGVAGSVTPEDYQYNVSRNNSFIAFEEQRLTLDGSTAGTRLVSDDESGAITDVIPAYHPRGRSAPYVYFDSRTYGAISDSNIESSLHPYNHYLSGDFGGVRPYLSGAATGGFANADTYQVLSAGVDDGYGTLLKLPVGDDQSPLDSGGTPVYFSSRTGKVVTSAGAAAADIRAFQEVGVVKGATENLHLDNCTNFSASTLESDLEE